MGRHSGEGSSFHLDSDSTPQPGSRRALLLAERAARLAALEAEAQNVAAELNQISSNLESAAASPVVTTARSLAVPQSTQRVSEYFSDQVAFPPLSKQVSESDLDLTSPLDVSAPILLAEENGVTAHSRLRSFLHIKKVRATSAAVIAVVSTAGALSATQGDSVTADKQADSDQLAAFSTAQRTVNPAETVFTLHVDGETKTITTKALTLGEALQGAGITLGDLDKVSVPMVTPVTNDLQVTIVRVSVERVSEEVVEKFQSSKVEDDTLEKGTTKVETAGQDGVTTNTYEVRYEDGKEVSRQLVISAQTTPRVDEVIHVGTKEKEAPVVAASSGGSATSASVPAPSAPAIPASSVQQMALDMFASYGWGADQFSCLNALWTRESGWNYLAQNPSSGAYGIPQALPGSKMASAGADWRTNPATQIKWGLGYIAGRYGSPCGAYNSSKVKGWY